MSDKIGKYELTETDETLTIKSESMSDKVVKTPNTDTIKVNGAWYLDALPNSIVVELENGELTKFHMAPFRGITTKDFTTYKSYHPRKCKGQPLPSYLYRFYGLEKSDESATETIHIRLTPTEKSKLDSTAKNEGKTISEFVRDYIRGL